MIQRHFFSRKLVYHHQSLWLEWTYSELGIADDLTMRTITTDLH